MRPDREEARDPEEAQDWACGPLGWWPSLASAPGGGVSWGYLPEGGCPASRG
jgi:hypothetical protein